MTNAHRQILPRFLQFWPVSRDHSTPSFRSRRKEVSCTWCAPDVGPVPGVSLMRFEIVTILYNFMVKPSISPDPDGAGFCTPTNLGGCPPHVLRRLMSRIAADDPRVAMPMLGVPTGGRFPGSFDHQGSPFSAITLGASVCVSQRRRCAASLGLANVRASFQMHGRWVDCSLLVQQFCRPGLTPLQSVFTCFGTNASVTPPHPVAGPPARGP